MSDPDDYNGYKWGASTSNGKLGGYAEFSEYGEILEVWDTRNDGRRTVADINICYGGKWIDYKHYDSGPHEGAIDYEKYNLAFKDGRKITMRVCQRSSGKLINCGYTLLMVA